MSKSQPKSVLPPAIPLDDLRMLFGDVTVSHVNHLERQGVIEKAERGMYTLASVGAYVRWLRKVQSGPADWRDVRTQIGQERLALLRLERGRLEGSLLDKEGVRSMNCDIASTIKTRLLAVAPYVAPRLTGLRTPAEGQAIVDAAITDALVELSNLALVADGSARRRHNGRAAPG
jgi:hypothetical protein